MSENVIVYLPTDGDLLYLYKSKVNDIPKYNMVKELLSHRPSKLALWKTFGEFKLLFEKKHGIPPNMITEKRKAMIPSIISEFSGKGYEPKDITVINAKSKHAAIDINEIMIDMGEDPLTSFTDIFGKETEDTKRFFYVFVPNDLEQNIMDLREKVCGLFK